MSKIRSPKCQAQGGVANCTSPRCPERQAFLGTLSSHTPAPFLTHEKPATFVGSWTDEDTILFKTPSGSALYGMNHKDSDVDYYIISPTRYVARQVAKQSIIDGIDTVTVDFSQFTEMAEKGVPQALEAMFSRKASSPYFEAYRQGFYASDPRVIKTYMRTIRSFSLYDASDFKMRRHALRLAFNLNELLHKGRFNPTLPRTFVKDITKAATLPDKEYFKALRKQSIIELDWDENDRGRQFEKEYVAARRKREADAWEAYLKRTGQIPKAE